LISHPPGRTRILGRNTAVDMQRFLTNRQRFPPDELAKYAGKYIAWSPDGTRILASDDRVSASTFNVGAPSTTAISSLGAWPSLRAIWR